MAGNKEGKEIDPGERLFKDQEAVEIEPVICHDYEEREERARFTGWDDRLGVALPLPTRG
jgi:hypothetical protein